VPAAVYLELYFLAIAGAIAFVAVQHMRAYWRWAQAPESELDVAQHRSFVTVQMWCTVTFLGAFLAALALAILQNWRDPGLISLLPVPLYWVPWLLLRPARRIEEDLRNIAAPDPAVQQQLDRITYVWKHRLFPIF
jgi:hypothetical protein